MNAPDTKFLTKVTTGICRLSYLKVAKPEVSKLQPQQGPRYSVCVLIPKTDAKTIGLVKGAVKAALDTQFPKGAPPKWKDPLRDGDVDHPGDKAYAGMMFVNAWTGEDTPPMLREGENRTDVVSPRDWVSGDWGNVILNFRGFDQSGSKGVGAYLGGIWFRKKGEPLVSSVQESDFDNAFGEIEEDFLG